MSTRPRLKPPTERVPAEDVYALAEELARRQTWPLRRYFAERGPFARTHYPQHLKWIRAGRTHPVRAFMAANRVGKTLLGTYELTLHLTGEYDEYAPWWDGYRFDRPIVAWVAGDTGKTVRDIIQPKLLGSAATGEAGLVPPPLLREVLPKYGVPEGLELIRVAHRAGGLSTLVFKSYDQGRTAFQGTGIDVILLDEEPPDEVFSECLLRIVPTGERPGGRLMLTFVPLRGLSPLVARLLPMGALAQAAQDGWSDGHQFTILCSWDQVPHLSEADRAAWLSAMQPYEREARTKGIPLLGSGLVYPVPEDDIRIPDFELPAHWPRGWAMDAGWQVTAVVWGALDPATDTLYIWAVYRREHADPSAHAMAILSRGAWMPGVGDLAGISPTDGRQLIGIYRDELGLDVELADKAVDAGILAVWQRLTTGRLRVFQSCTPWFEEFRLYRRDERGRIIKEHDHLMDATRYLVRAVHRFRVPPEKPDGLLEARWTTIGPGRGEASWMW